MSDAALLGLPETIGGTEDDEDLIGEEGEGEEGEGEGAELSEVDRVLARYEQDTAAYRRTIDQLIAARPAGAAATSQPALEVDFSDLPDPVTHKADFEKELATRTTAALTKAQEQERQASRAAQQDAAVKALWSDFAKEYADLAPKELLASSAAAAELQALSAQGLDSLQWALDNSSDFRKKVADRMRKELGTSAAPKAKQTSASRTAGVGGGSKGGAGASGEKPKKPAGFIEQLKKSQLDAGLI